VVVKRLMASLLYGVSASDPLTFVIIPVVLTLVTLAALGKPGIRQTAYLQLSPQLTANSRHPWSGIGASISESRQPGQT
jgi:hypothetical protein